MPPMPKEVLISDEGDHEPAHHLMIVDGHALLIDLSGIGTLLDPTVSRVTWGMVSRGSESRPGGTVQYRRGGQRVFFEPELLAPYLDAYRARRAQLEAEQVAFELGADADGADGADAKPPTQSAPGN